MQTDNFIISLDVGTQYIKASALSVFDESVIHGARGETKGMTKEGQINPEELGEAIKNTINKLELILNQKIKSAYVSLPMEFARVEPSEGHSLLAHGEVTEQDLNQALDSAKRVFYKENEDVVDFLTANTMVDDTLYLTPCGVKGEKLTLNGQAVLGEKIFIQGIQRALDNAGLKGAGFVLSSSGAASLLLTKTDLRRGVVLVDVGASSTRLTLYKDQMINDFSWIKIGGRNITKDISIVLKKTMLEAENLKKAYGKGQRDFNDVDENLLEEVIVARINEIMSYVEEFVKKHEDLAIEKVVCYGGGLCGFINIQDLYKSNLKQSTNFMTSDIIRDETVLHIHSGGIAYRLLSGVSCEDLSSRFTNLEDNEINKALFPDDDNKRRQNSLSEKYRDTVSSNESYEDSYDEDDDDDAHENKFIKWIKKILEKIKNK